MGATCSNARADVPVQKAAHINGVGDNASAGKTPTQGAADLISKPFKDGVAGRATGLYHDIVLDRLDYAKLDVEKFDGFMSSVEAPVNTMVETSNQLNEVVMVAQEQIAAALGAFRVEISYSLRGRSPVVILDRDAVLLRLEKAVGQDQGSVPQPEEVQNLCASNPGIEAADEKLGAALATMYTFFELHNKGISQQGDSIVPPFPDCVQVDAVNEALTELRTALGSGYRVALEVKPAALRNCKGMRVRLVKALVEDGQEDVKYDHATFLDVAKTKEAKQIYHMLSRTTDACAAVVKSMQAVPSDMYRFHPCKHRIALEIRPIDKDEPQPALVAAALQSLKAAVDGANTHVFELRKHAMHANGPITVGTGLVGLFDEIVAAQARALGTSPEEAKASIKFEPSVRSLGENVTLDMPVEVSGKEGGVAMRSMQEVANQLLPPKGKVFYEALMSINEASMDITPRYPRLQGQIKDLISQADAVFSNPEQDIREACPDKQAQDVDQKVQLATRNLQAVKGSAGVLDAFLMQVHRLTADLQQACQTIKDRTQQ
ncbi:hypothetical protein DUNSADRAFT_227 [Dunaliella salina]|uniref:Uncharacterized protein n=1 Tax=Dunaliella salina TaxID=3046 RepID=A0ABQ7GYK3_DUNSA|nr:hypothetical protein DUNSADRAFT_227 [Dunaliella salina]|eukprot:KAF5839676.1 hypothetical protein DUNSADRAFT_227 [Dunaliella salina]